MGNCFSNKKFKTNLKESVDDEEYKFSTPSKLSTIVEERTIDINITSDKI